MNTVEEQLHYQSAFQNLLITLATKFINQPVAQMDEAVVQALRQIVEYFGAMRASINQYTDHYARYTPLYHWAVPGATLLPDTNTKMPDSVRVTSLHWQGEVVAVPDVAELPEQGELSQFLRHYGISAVVTVPILNEGQLFGFVSISWYRPMPLGSELVGLLRLVGEIFVNALNRKRNEETIQQFNEALEQRVAERTAELLRVNNQLQAEIHQREQVEESLRQSERQLRAILDSLPISIFVSNLNELLYVNPISSALLGLDAQRLSDYNVDDFFANVADRAEVAKVFAAQGYVRDFGLPIRAHDGSVRFGLITTLPFQFAGQFAFLSAIVDITELRQTQDTEREHRNLIEALLDSALALTSTLQLDEVVKHILRSVNLVASHDVANLIVLDGDEAQVLGSRDYVAGDLDYKLVTTRFNFQEHYYMQLMAQTREPVIIGDISTEPRFIRISQGPVLRAYLGLPIIVGQELIGLISLGSQQADFFTETHARYLKIFALQAGIAIQNARLYDQAKTIATLEERHRLARELHDSVTQTLFAANTLAEALPRVMQRDQQKGLRYLNDLHQLTRGAMAEMRSLLVELHPEALMRTDLSVLLTQLCEVFTGRTQIEVSKELTTPIILPPNIQIVFYRAAQEALNNIAKYARATHVQIALYSKANRIELRVTDDGLGFDPEQVTANRLGLKFMRERAANIQAELAIFSKVGSGTEIILNRLLP